MAIQDKNKTEPISKAAKDSMQSTFQTSQMTATPDRNTATPGNRDKEISKSTEEDNGTSVNATHQMTKKAVPVLYYHAVNDSTEGIEELFVKTSEFEKQMGYLYENGYTSINFDEIEKVQNIDKPVIITFDDGYEDNYLNAYPILKKYNLKATIFLAVGLVGNPSILNTEQIKAMSDLVSFQSHTLTHQYLTKLGDDELEKELAYSKSKIEEITNQKVDVLAYPFGDYDQRVMNCAKKYYKYAVAMGGGMHYTGNDLYEIKRLYIPRSLSFEGFKQKLTQK